MQRARIELMPDQRFVQNIHLGLAIAEDQRVLHVLSPDQSPERLALVMLGDQRQPLGDPNRHGRRPRNGDLLRVLQKRIGEPP